MGAAQPVEEPVAHHASFIVVGIGASAGGLESLGRFFKHMPAASGMAFVVVVHLHPEYESHMAELLQRHTTMPVMQVTEDLVIEPNRVYVIPPNQNLSTIDTHLRLSELEERAKRAPIDHFFRTLAETHHEQAIGIVLSGTGSDGAVGLRRIKERGGVTVVQEPNDAAYNGMPQSAIATGQVDMVVPVEAMPARLMDYVASSPQITVPDDSESLPPTEHETLHRILTALRMRTGHDFSAYKQATMLRRLRRRMQMTQMEDANNYLQLLRADGQEAQMLVRDLLITVTNFFRDSEVFTALELEIIPQLFKDRGPQDQIRVWVVGCATGEEAYSLAMLLLEHAARLERPPTIQIFASDISKEALIQAKEGHYPETIAADIKPERLERFFVKGEHYYRVKKEVREVVLFASHNILKDPPFSRVDLISCRNLLIYLKREVQQKVFDSFHYALRTEGYLLLGRAESVEGEELFQAVNKSHNLFQRYGRPNWRPPVPGSPFPRPGTEAITDGLELTNGKDHESKEQSGGLLHQQMVEQYAPPSVLVNADYNMVHLSENVGRYLHRLGGDPTNNILKSVRDELRLELTAGLFSAFEEGKITRTKPIPLLLEGDASQVCLHIRPGTSRELHGLALVIFEEDRQTEGESGESEQANKQLEQQLEQWPRRLQRAIEGFESSKEGMQAANEELLSMNEELRSAAEELETSKEELQSMNEELVTVNQENHNKMEELNQLNSDLQNLLAATNIATLFLDRQLRIKRFTSKIGELFNVMPSDQGRPLAHLTHRLGQANLLEDAAQVLKSLSPIEREISSESGQWQLTRLFPYRTVDDHIDGVVITFVDITGIKQAEEALRQSEQNLKTLNEGLEEQVDHRTADVRRLASELLVVEQRTQQQISQVLHDELQQLLFSMQLQLTVLGQHWTNGDERFLEQFQEVKDTLEEAIQTTRQVALNLSPPILRNEDFGDSLNWLAGYMQERYGLKVKTEARLRLGSPPEELRIFIFQAVRELLFNVFKHAGADQAHVSIFEEGGHLQVVVSDKGQGFDTTTLTANELPLQSSLGLSSIRDRLRLFGGQLEVESKVGEGTQVRITLW